MIKLVIQQRIITKYRIDVFNNLAKKYDLTVIHGGPVIKDDLILFKQIVKKNYQIGPFFFQNIFNVVRNKNILITEANLRFFFNNFMLAFIPRSYKWITWGIGVSASYTNGFDKNKKFDFLRYFFFRRSDALLFYSNYPVKKYKSAKFDEKRLFVAHNTFPNYCKFNKKRKHFLFIGSLIKGKGLFQLLNEYKISLNNIGDNLPPLKIIGTGKLLNELKTFINKNDLKHKVFLLGPIYDQNKLNEILSSSFLSISPGQVGLALLHSMSCGVTFVTSKTAITGGEIFNINNKNGILINDISELRKIFCSAYNNPDKYIKIGKNAYDYYYQKRSLSTMISGFTDAIEFLSKKTV